MKTSICFRVGIVVIRGCVNHVSKTLWSLIRQGEGGGGGGEDCLTGNTSPPRVPGSTAAACKVLCIATRERQLEVCASRRWGCNICEVVRAVFRMLGHDFRCKLCCCVDETLSTLCSCINSVCTVCCYGDLRISQVN